MTSHRGDNVDESDVRELRTLLKNAQSDVKRYAALVVRLQQELDRERLKTHSATTPQEDTDSLSALHDNQEAEDEEVEGVLRRSETVREALQRLVHSASRKCAVCQKSASPIIEEHNAACDSHAELGKAADVIERQRQQLVWLARENAKLRDALEKRPRHRDLALCQWQVESLQTEVATLRYERRRLQETRADAVGAVPVFEHTPDDSLTDRISVDKLLSWLHVECKKLTSHTTTNGRRRRSNRRRFLKAPIECYLVLDAAALEGASKGETTESDRMKKREQLSRRVGVLCSQIVASCCHSIGIYEVEKLPRYVEASYHHSQLVPLLQDFVYRVDELTLAAMIRTTPSHEKLRHDQPVTDNQGFLDSVAARVQDLVFEVRARREQMKPPGDAALATVMKCMKQLDVHRVNELGPAIEQLQRIAGTEREFLREARKLLGLDHMAPRADVLALIRQLMEIAGLRERRQQAPRKAAKSPAV